MLRVGLSFARCAGASSLAARPGGVQPMMLASAPDVLEALRFSTGHPKQAGQRPQYSFQKRKPKFDPMWKLNLNRMHSQPSTPAFPEGVPFKKIRGLTQIRSPKQGVRRNVKLFPFSIKRGR